MTSTPIHPPPVYRRLTKGWVLAAVGLAVLMSATVLSGTAAAQTDPCQSQQNQVNQIKAMLRTDGTPGADFFNTLLQPQIDLANLDVRDCRERVAETEHDRLRGERSRAGNAYANIRADNNPDYFKQRQEAREAWKEADQAVRDHEAANPSVERNQPYNDGLSDFERHYCVSRPDNAENSIINVETHGDGTYTSNMNTATCSD